MKISKNMMKSFPFLIIALMIIFSSCESDSGNQNNSENSEGSSPPAATQQETASQPENKFTFLTNGYWIYQHRIMVNEEYQGNPYENHWIDLHTDYTFDRGQFGEVLFSGTYNYNHDKGGLLHLVPNDPREQPQSEWKVLHSVDAIVLQGTRRFGNNNEQIKLLNSATLPEKSE